MRLTSIAIAAGLCLAAAHGVAGAADFSFSGRGFGHGVGLSQYGAFGAAKAGWGEARIVRFYYPGTRLGTAAAEDRRLRVLVSEGRVRTPVLARRGIVLRGGAGGVVRLPAGNYRLEKAEDRVVLRAASGATVAARLPARLSSGSPLAVAGVRYRGALEVHDAAGRRLDVVNEVPLEAYLRGVVPKEVPDDWGRTAPAAVRAQAIVARSYALASRRRAGHFQLHADTRSQVYGGLDAERARTSAAVRATRGRVVTYRGEVVTTFFYSTSGGRTASAEEVWGEPAPYLVSRRDPFDRVSPYHRWPEPVRVSGRALADGLGLDEPVAGVAVLDRARSPRVARARVVTADGASRTVTGAELQAAAGLRSTWFSVRRVRG